MEEVMGFPDDLKLLSSMTLFEFISGSNSIFTKMIELYFDDERDENSIKLIRAT
jgi:uncharacterized protein (DUF1810 family)